MTPDPTDPAARRDAVQCPPAPVTGGARLLRATVLGTASMALATAAHLAGGGTLPSAGLLTVAGLVVALVAVTVTARRCRSAVLLGVLGIEQAALHLVFTASAAAVRCGTLSGSAMPHAAVGPTVAQHALAACAATPGMTGTSMTGAGMSGAGMSGAGWTMWAGHIAATLVTGVLLARGEAYLWRVVDHVVAAATVAPGRRPHSTRPREQSAYPVAALSARTYPVADPRGPPVLV